MDKLYEIENLRCSYDKNYQEGVSKVVLEIKKLDIPRGKKIFIVGESGIGKSTILETLGMMNNTIIRDSNSRMLFYNDGGDAVDLTKLWTEGDSALSAFRLKHFSFIFQSTNLMHNFTAYENIALTRMLQGHSKESSFAHATEVLKDLGLERIKENRMTQELSGGQQQRLAFARAIMPDFTVLFGDEPTGNLDSDNAIKAMDILSRKLSSRQGCSAIIVSHDMHLATLFADVIIKIKKNSCQSATIKDEVTYYGVIDDDCIFTPATNNNWTNGTVKFSQQEFETYLKKW